MTVRLFFVLVFLVSSAICAIGIYLVIRYLQGSAHTEALAQSIITTSSTMFISLVLVYSNGRKRGG
jgi:hypothetical protein